MDSMLKYATSYGKSLFSSDDNKPTVIKSSKDHDITSKEPTQKTIHEILGGGKVADVLLWRDANVAFGILLGMTLIWYIFEVVGYSIVTLLCHIAILQMLILYSWATFIDHLVRECHINILPQDAGDGWNISTGFNYFRKAAVDYSIKPLWDALLKTTFINKCIDIYDQIMLPLTDVPIFLLIIVSLYVLSVIGSHCSFLTMIYIGFLCLLTLPIVYERNEEQINKLFRPITAKIKKRYNSKRYPKIAPEEPKK